MYVLNTTDAYILKWLKWQILCSVYFTLIWNKEVKVWLWRQRQRLKQDWRSFCSLQWCEEIYPLYGSYLSLNHGQEKRTLSFDSGQTYTVVPSQHRLRNYYYGNTLSTIFHMSHNQSIIHTHQTDQTLRLKNQLEKKHTYV